MRHGRIEYLSSLLALRRRQLGVCIALELCSLSLELKDMPFSSSAAKESRFVAVDRDDIALYRLLRGVLNSSLFIVSLGRRWERVWYANNSRNGNHVTL